MVPRTLGSDLAGSVKYSTAAMIAKTAMTDSTATAIVLPRDQVCAWVALVISHLLEVRVPAAHALGSGQGVQNMVGNLPGSGRYTRRNPGRRGISDNRSAAAQRERDSGRENLLSGVAARRDHGAFS